MPAGRIARAPDTGNGSPTPAAPSAAPLLQARELRKSFGPIEAVCGVDLDLPAGSCTGLLGPNGAGKTTTLEMLEGITPPSGGRILYRREPLGPRFRDRAGIMFQATALPEFITVRETLEMFARLYPRTRPLAELVERCALQDYLDRDNRRLSGGQRQRMLLAIALVSDPDILFLDEPTTGLDPQARRNFWQLIEDIKAEGKTVLLSTHYMEEAYTLCDEVAIMDRGRIIARGTPDALLARHYNDVVLQLPGNALPGDGAIVSLPMRRRHDTIEIETGDVNTAIAALLEAGVALDGLRIRGRTLEDLFLELTGKELRA